MRSHALATVAACAVAAAGLALGSIDVGAQPRGASGESTMLAVLRRDGILVPFANLENGKWKNGWPDPGRRVDIPITLEASPKGWWLKDRPVATWTAWPFGGTNQAVHVRNPVNFTAECERHVGLQTDYRSAAPVAPPDMQPFPKDGLATSGDLVVEPIEVLNSTWTDWQKVAEALAAPFSQNESKLVKAASSPRLKGLTDERRRNTPVALESLVRSPGPEPGTWVLYFEAVKRYGRDKKTESGLRSGPMVRSGAPGFMPPRDPLFYGTGWARMGTDGQVTLDVTVYLSDSEREGLLYTLPLGRFTAGGKAFWAVQRAGWGFERYEIVELAGPEPKVVMKTSGGMCG